MQFFDTHAHIGLIYNDPIEQLRVLQEARKANVTRIVSIYNSLHDFGKVYNNLKSLPYVYHAVGVAPSEVVNPGKDWIQTIEASVKLPNVVAIGEVYIRIFWSSPMTKKVNFCETSSYQSFNWNKLNEIFFNYFERIQLD